MTEAAQDPSPNADDVRLAQRAVAGDEQAIEAFAARMTCVGKMVRAVDRRLRANLAPQELEDLTQDVLVLVWRKLAEYEGRASLESWVLRFVFLEIRTHLRRRDRTRLEKTGELDLLEAEDRETLGADAYAVLLSAVRELRPPAGDVLHLRHHDQLTFDQIGRRLGIPENTAKTIYHRSLAKLRTRLGRSLQEELS